MELLAEELANNYGGEYCASDGQASIEEPLDSLLQAVHTLVHPVHALGKLVLAFFKTPKGVGGLALPVL